MSTAVWVGNPDARVPLPGYSFDLAGPIWHDYMSAAAAEPCDDFPEPKDPVSLSPGFGSHTVDPNATTTTTGTDETDPDQQIDTDGDGQTRRLHPTTSTPRAPARSRSRRRTAGTPAAAAASAPAAAAASRRSGRW